MTRVRDFVAASKIVAESYKILITVILGYYIIKETIKIERKAFKRRNDPDDHHS